MLVELMFLFEFCEVNRVSCVTAATEPLYCPLGLDLGKKIEDNLVFYKEVVNYPKELVWGEGESWHAQFL